VLDIYERFALSEATAFIYLPLLLLFARRLARGGTWRDALFLALSYAGLVCTHLVSGYLISLFLGGWLLAESGGRGRALARPALALCGGLLLAGPALAPALVDKQEVNVAWLREMPNGDVRSNFLFRDEVLPEFGGPDPVKKPVLLSAHSQLGLSAAALGLVLASPAWRRTARRKDALVMAAVSLIAYVMQTPLSQPVWLVVPELATVQFPWRLQTLMVLSAALLGGMAIHTLREGGLSRSAARLGSAALAAMAAANLALSIWTTSLRPFIWEESVVTHPAVTTWVEPAFTPTGYEDYRRMPQMPPESALPRAQVATGQARILDIDWRSARRRIEIEAHTAARVHLGSFWFPGWKAEMDGRPLALEPVPPLATIGFDVPAGRHVVTLRFGPTPAQGWGWVLMGAGAAGMAALAWAWRVRPRASGT
jgi:hypothetical protein